METEEYKRGLEKLLKIIEEDGNTALMCREKLWFKCHRRFIANDLTKKSIKIVHIIEAGKLKEHKLSGAAPHSEPQIETSSNP